MSVSVTLRQEKKVLTDTFALTSWITAADPSGMYPLFVVSEGIEPEDEQWERVADLDDLAKYSENPLVQIRAAGTGAFNSISATVTDILEITNPPELWMTTYFTSAKFEVVYVDPAGNYLLVSPDKPFPTAMQGVTWTLRNFNETVTRGSGSSAKIRREDTSDTVWLRRHWAEAFATVKKAHDRLGSNESYVAATVADAKTYGVDFTGVETETYLGDTYS